ncbi:MULTISPECIES: PRD domain-containing protein [Enterococcus]|uniref:PRD domain-containing protein n=1 Tax=Enterococcus TaxID=1350 RepID=UPI000EB9E131|nr:MULTISPECIES: PRD domain-containing protein [Enterococcus]HCM84722.1 transcription antiterminator LicT [Enterococcus sp.]
MIIKKIYNNNAIMVEDQNNNEVILVGKGLAFNMQKEDQINPKLAEKKFELTKEINHRFEELVTSIPLDYILLSERVIAHIKEKSTKKISDSIYVTLTDHIVMMIERIKKGVDFDSLLLLNVKSLYKEEYNIALTAIELINHYLNMTISREEANFITLHIVNAESDFNMMQNYTIIEIITLIQEIVDRHFSIEQEDNRAYDRFLTHCRFFVQQIVNSNYVRSEAHSNRDMLNTMKEAYSEQYQCVKEISLLLKQKYGYLANHEEEFYLLIHIIRLST